MADYGSSVNFSERTTDIDTPPSGKAGIFLRDDKALYLKNDEGTVTKFGLAGDAPTAHAESHESGGTDELSLDAGQVTTGTLPVGRGGTNADLSATGGTGQVLKQTSAGGAVTVGVLAESEIPDLSTDKLTSGTLPIARGGTNATTAGGALTSLGAVATTDSRLSDARTPTTHAESHENGGDDELALDASQVTTGTLPVARGGTGATTLTGFVQGTGTSALTASDLGASDLPAGTLKLDAALSSTLQTVEDKAGNESALQIATTGICLLTDSVPLEFKRKTLGTGAGKGASFVRFLDDTDGQRGVFGFISTENDGFSFKNNTDEEGMTFAITNASSFSRAMIRMDGGDTDGRLAFFGTAPQVKPTVSGSRGGNAALASLCTALANLGLITDSTT